MQQYHRNRHRILWLILTPLILLALIIGIAKRPSWPNMESLPGNTETQSFEN